MQFQRKRSAGNFSNIGKLLIKIIILVFLILIAVFLIDKIDFPSPKKNIEKIIPNENFKVVK